MRPEILSSVCLKEISGNIHNRFIKRLMRITNRLLIFT